MTVDLSDGDLGPVVPDPTQPEVVVRGRCRKTDSCWLVTLFLVNEQLPVKSNVDERWLFQIELAAQAVDGAPVFVGRRVALPAETQDGDDEVRRLDLLYRDQVELAVGHGVAVGATVAEGDPHRATAVRTAVLPRSEVAKVEAPRPDDPALDDVERSLMGGVTFDMEALAQLDGPGAAEALRPLADTYDHWLDRQAERATTRAGPQAWRDLWRSGPPMAMAGTLSRLFPFENPDHRGIAAFATLLAAMALTIAIVVIGAIAVA